MLLLEDYFFFADQFAEWIMAQAQTKDLTDKCFRYSAYKINSREEIGDLMGAIHGFHFTGFIGEVYKKFPFPKAPEDFKQNPDGFKTQEIMRSELEKWAAPAALEICFHGDGTVQIGTFVFLKNVFHELIRYVWRGGYPRWKNETRPDYIMTMKQEILISRENWFKGVFS